MKEKSLCTMTFLFLVSICMGQSKIIVIDSTVKELKIKLANIYLLKQLEKNIPFYSPVYVRQVTASPIIVPPLEVNVIQHRLEPNQHQKFDMWGRSKRPLYMQPNRYDWMSKVRERERH